LKKIFILIVILLIVIFAGCNNVVDTSPLTTLEVAETAQTTQTQSVANHETTIQSSVPNSPSTNLDSPSSTIASTPIPSYQSTLAPQTPKSTPKPTPTKQPTPFSTPAKTSTPKPSTPILTQKPTEMIVMDSTFINGILLGINDIKAEDGYPPVASVDVKMSKGCVEHAKKMALANKTHHSTDNFFLESCSMQALGAQPQPIGWAMVFHVGQLTECEKIGIGVIQYNNQYWVVVRGD